MLSKRYNHEKMINMAAYLLMLLIIIFMIKRNHSTLSGLQIGNLGYLIPYSALVLFQIFLSGLSNKILYGNFMKPNTVVSNIRLAIINTLGNYMPVSAGILSKGLYAKKVNQLPYNAYTILTLFQLSSVFVICGASFLVVTNIISLPEIYYFSLLFFVIGIIGIWDIYKIIPKRIRAKITKEKYYEFRSIGLKQYPLQLFIQGLILIVSSVKLQIVFEIIGIDINIWEVLFILSSISLTRYISFTPGGVGVKETIGGVIARMIGQSFSMSFIVITLDRIVDLVITFLVLPVAFVDFKKNET